MNTFLRGKIFIFFLLIANSGFGQILLDQKFNNSSLPAGWTSSAIQGTLNWSFTNTPAFTTTSGSYYAKFEDTQASSVNNAFIMTPALNCVGRTSVKLRFEHYWDDVELIHCYVEVSPDNGTTWVEAYSDVTEGAGDIGSYASPMTTTLDITAIVLGQSQARVRFRFVNEGSTAGKSWNIDDILIYTDPGLKMAKFTTPNYLGCSSVYAIAELVSVKVVNKGINNISNFPVKVDVITGAANGISTTLTTTYTPVLVPGDTAFISFPADLLDMSADDEYGFIAYTELATDGYLYDDTIITSRRQRVTNYDHNEDFDLTSEGWKPTGGNSTNYWKWGKIPASYLTGDEGNDKSWYIVRDGSATYTDLQLESPVFDLSSLVNPIISFDIKYSLGNDLNNRAVYLEYSTDDGATWHKIGTGSDLDWYNSNGNGTGIWADTWKNATLNNYINVQHDLCELFGETCVKFRINADNIRYSDKFTIDNFTIKDKIDIGLTAFLAPNNVGCTFTSTQEVSIRVYNSTCNPISNVPVKCDISGAITQNLIGTVPGPIPVSGSKDFTFPATVDMTTVGVYTFTSYTDDPADENRSNDTIIRSLGASFTKISTFPYFEDFEADDGGWQSAGGDASNFWTWGVLPYLNGAEVNGSSWYLQKNGSATFMDMYLNSPVFDFRENTKPILSFDIKYDLGTDYNDRAVVVEYSLDGGVNWTALGTNTDPNWYNSHSDGSGYWANSWKNATVNTWTHVKHDMCYLSGEECVKLRIIANNVCCNDKFAIDNIRVDFGTGDDIQPLEIYPNHAGTCTGFTSAEKIGVLIQNNTCRPLTNVPVHFELSGAGAKVLDDIIPGPIYRFSRYHHIFRKEDATANIGEALDFDGSNDYVEANCVSSSLSNPTAITCEAWFNPSTTKNTFFMAFNTSTGDNTILFGTNADKIKVHDGTDHTGTTKLTTGTWYHFALTIDNSNNAKVYINGVLEFSFTCTKRPALTDRFTIGMEWDGASPSDFFEGMIDEVRIWNIARTQPQISGSMLAPLVGNEAGLIVYYDMEDGTGSSVLSDQTVTGCNGTLTNMSPTTDWVPTGAVKTYVEDTFDMSAAGTYNLEVITGDNNIKGSSLYWSAINDTSAANNTYSQNRYNNIISTFPHTSTFDASNEGWASYPLTILNRYWHNEVVPYNGGAAGKGKSWYVSTDGSNTAQDFWVESPVYDLTGLSNPLLNFYIKYSISTLYSGNVFLEYSTNGGTTWTKLGTNNEPEWYNYSNYWKGGLGSWQYRQHNLCNIIGATCVKFRFYADNLIYGDNFAFDDFSIVDEVDATVTEYLAPLDLGCLFGDQQHVAVSVFSHACTTLSDAPLTCDVTGPTNTTLNGTTDLPPTSWKTYTFPDPFDMVQTGTYNFNTYVTIPDFRPGNDAATTSVNVNELLISSYPYLENFDLDDGKWTPGTGDAAQYWEWGTLSYLNGDEGNNNSWYLVRNGSATYSDQWLISPVFDFTQSANYTLSFDIKYDLGQDVDDRAVYVQYALSGGGSWTTLGDNNDIDWYNSHGDGTGAWANTWKNATVNTWTHVEHNLCPVVGNSCVRFRIIADDVRYSDKFSIDNVSITQQGKDDIQPLQIYKPGSGTCTGYTSAEKVGVLIQNNTCNELMYIPVKLDVTGALTRTIFDTIPGPVSDARYYYTLREVVQSKNFGTSLDFDGINDFVEANCVVSSLNNPVAYTTEAWFKPTGASHVRNVIMALNTDIGNNTLFYGIDDNGKIYVNNESTSFTGTTNLYLGTWYHIAITIDASNNAKVYLNGNLEISYTTTLRPGLTDTYSIGQDYDAAVTSDFFRGQIDEVRIWNTARTPAEINANMFNTLVGNEAGLIAYFDMEDGSGSSVLTDKTANACVGNLQNMDPANDWISGMTAKSYQDVTIDMSAGGTYNLELSTDDNTSGVGMAYINDTLKTNDVITEVRYSGKINSFPYLQTFETDNAGWASVPLNILNKYWHNAEIPFLNGEQGNGKSWYLDGLYKTNATYRDLWVESPEFDFSTLTSPVVSFDIKYSLAYDLCDRAVIFQYSLDGGTTWVTVGTNSDPDWYKSGTNTCLPNTWSDGTVSTWTKVQHSLCAAALQNCVKFRFYADNVRYADKFVFDNFYIEDLVDVSTTAYITPNYSGCLHTDQTTVTVTVFNGSCSDIANIPIVCDITGANPASLSETIAASVPAAGSLNYTFATTFDMLPVGKYNFTTYTNFATDPDRTNDTIRKSVDVYHQRVLVPNTENYDANSGLGTWRPGGGDAGNYWNWGTVPYLGGPEGQGNSWYLVKNGSGTYMDIWLESPVYDFTGVLNPSLTFDIQYSLANDLDDRAVRVEYSVNGGSTWTTLGANTDANWYDSHANGNGIWANTWKNATVSSWQEVNHDLCNLKNQSCVMFRIYADNVLSNDKFAIDNFSIIDLPVDLEMISAYGCYGYLQDVQLEIKNRDENFCQPYILGANVAGAANNGIFNNMDNTNRVVSDLHGRTDNCGENFAKVLDLDGSNDYVEANSVSVSLNNPAELTMEAWIKPTSSASKFFMAFNTSIGDNTILFGVFGGILKIHDGTDHFGTTTLNVGTWYHVAYTVDNLNNAKIYVDGNLDASFTSTLRPALTDKFTIGMEYDGATPSDHFNGQIDEVRIWNTALSQIDLQNNMCDILVGNEAGLKSYYKMEEAAGTTTITDASGNGNTGTLKNMDAASDRVNSDLAGGFVNCASNLGKALIFNGSNEYVSADNIGEKLNNSNTITIEAWLKPTAEIMTDYIAFNTSSGGNTFLLRVNANRQVEIHDNTITAFGTTVLSLGTWYHVAVTVDEADNLTVYLNGNIEFTITTTQQVGISDLFSIGQEWDGSLTSDFYKGEIDEVRIWNTARTQAEINAAMCNPLVGNESGLVVYYDMEGTSNTIITDRTENLVPGTASASSTKAGSSPEQAFNGNNTITGWANNNVMPSWLQYDFGAGNEKAIEVYRIYCSGTQEGSWNSENYNPKTWTFEASNDAVSWDVLQTVANGYLTLNTWSDFEYVNSTPYRYYRINISATEASTYTHITELQMYEDVTRTPPIITELDLSYSIDGGIVKTAHITGLEIKGGEIDQVILPNVLIPAVTSDFKVWLSNPNGISEEITINDTLIPNLSTWASCNDHCKYATEIISTVTYASQTNNATDDPLEDPGFTCKNNGPDGLPGTLDDLDITIENTVWYWFSTDCNGGDIDVTFRNIGGTSCSNGIQVSIDKLVALPECDPANYTNVYCNYPNNTNDFTWTGTNLDAEEIYYITIDGVANGQCDFELLLTGDVGFSKERALAGTYEINTTNVNYPTFQAAFDSLKVYGVKAPVIFKARDTVYYEQLDLQEICGVNEDTTVTFKSLCDDCARAKVQFSASTINFTCGTDFQTSLSFNGTNSYVEANDVSVAIGNPTQYSIEAWVKPRSFANARSVIAAFNTNIGNNTLFYCINSSGQIYVDAGDGNFTGTTVLELNKWYHVAVTVDNSNVLKVYINGSLELTGTTANRPSPTDQFSIGQEFDAALTSDFFNGEIDEVRVWNTALSETQINDNICTALDGTEAGLISYFNMEDGTESTILTDITGNANPGNLIKFFPMLDWGNSNIAGASYQTCGKDFSEVLDFGGSNDYVVANSVSADLNNPAELTMETWIKPTNATNFFLAFNTSIGGNTILIGLSANVIKVHDGTDHFTTSTLTLGKWYHVALTIDNSDNAKVYINGSLEASFTCVIRPATNDKFTIGMEWDNASPSDYFKGQIDEVRIWDIARTEAEIQANMCSPLPGGEANLIAYYQMENGIGSATLSDITGNGNTGTLTNMTPASDWLASDMVDIPSDCGADFNTSLDLDGINDYVEANNVSTILNNPTQLTVEAWIKPKSTALGTYMAFNTSVGGNTFIFKVNASQKVEIYDNANHTGIRTLEIGKWYHVAVSINNVNSAKVYINGILDFTFTTTFRPAANDRFSIGQEWDTDTPSDFYKGEIDEVRIWNTARTEAEINSTMCSPMIGNEAGLKAYFDMEDGTGSSTLSDITGNGSTGTLTAMDPATDWVGSINTANSDFQSITESFNNYTMKLNGAKYYNFDRIDFQALDTTYSRVVVLENVHNITFNDCIFTGDTTQTDNNNERSIIYSVPTSDIDTVSISNCEFIGGSFGVHIENTGNVVDEVQIKNNKFSNQSKSAISFLKHKNPQILYNLIESNSLRNDYAGISLTEITGALRIENNLLLDSLSDGTAILLDNATSTGGSEGIIANNMIRFGTADADASYGITLQNASSYQKVYHNSINLTSNAGSALNINGLAFGDVRNNIFNSSANSATIAGETNFTEGYNAFNPDYALKGTGSILQNPGFISASDLHTEEALLKSGTPLSVTTDIDDEGRNPVTPFMGADEFLGLVSWTGAVNKDWNNTGNWSSGQIPTRGTTVEIPLVVPNFPEINSKSTKLAEVRNITIHNGAHLYIEPVKYLTTYKNFTNNGEFLIKSDANGTGSFIPKTTPGTIAGTGTSKMQLFLTQNRWHYVASPITAATGIFSEYYYWWDETIKDRWYHNDFVDWTWDGTGTPGLTPTIMGWTLASGLMEVGEGYAYWFKGANKTVTFDGVFNSGDYEVSLDFTDQGGDAVQDIYDGWNLLANPYPSTINWNSEGITLTNVDNAVYVYSDDGSKSYDNYYYYMKGVANSPYPLIALNASDDSCHIAPGQSVFVRANAVGAKVKITNQARQHRVSTFYKSGEKHPNLLKLSAEHSGNTDELAIRFIPGASSGYDGEYDAIKRYSSSGKVPQISSQINAGELAINTLAEITDGLVIPLSFAAGESGKYSIKEMELNFEPNVNIYLTDKYLQNRIRLNDTPEYSFKTDAGIYKDRFYIVFKLEKSLTEENPEESVKIDELLTENVQIFGVKKSVNIKFENVQGNDNQVIVQDVLGKKIIHQKLVSDNTVLPMENFASGNYIVKVITQNKVYEEKVFIK